MAIYHFMFEAKPQSDNREIEVFEGAYITCWVDSMDYSSSLTKATTYIKDQGWEIISIEEQFIANRERYEGDNELKESLECFDQAACDGIAAIIHTWPHDD